MREPEFVLGMADTTPEDVPKNPPTAEQIRHTLKAASRLKKTAPIQFVWNHLLAAVESAGDKLTWEDLDPQARNCTLAIATSLKARHRAVQAWYAKNEHLGSVDTVIEDVPNPFPSESDLRAILDRARGYAMSAPIRMIMDKLDAELPNVPYAELSTATGSGDPAAEAGLAEQLHNYCLIITAVLNAHDRVANKTA